MKVKHMTIIAIYVDGQSAQPARETLYYQVGSHGLDLQQVRQPHQPYKY